MRKTLFPSFLMLCLALSSSGCAGQLKSAMKEHAQSVRSVADTIGKAASAIKCDGAAQGSDTCKAAVTTIEDQLKALREGADKLAKAAD